MKKEIESALANWKDEMNTAAIYQTLSDREKDERLKEVYCRMVAVEQKHAAKWVGVMKDAGFETPVFRLSIRTRLLMWLGKKFGPEMILPGMQAMEQQGTTTYQGIDGAKTMAAEERSHSRLITQITGTMRGGMEGGALAQLEGRHRSAGGNALRAAVLGANDGLCSNLSLVMGVAGASLSGQSILITGIAGLLAGALSMALGEWLSVQSSRELFSNQIKIEAEEIENSPAEEAEELALIYEARGLTKEQSVMLSNQIMSNKDMAVTTLVREELGIDPEELGGSAWEAAITSFVLFSLGAIFPVLPFMFTSGTNAVLWSIGLSTIALFLVGASITLFTGRGVLYSGMRMVVFGLITSGITFGIGKLIGVSLGG
ncbi:MAG: VIT1/CCC1 transporter family protein [Anaerolineaceae bacterium]